MSDKICTVSTPLGYSVTINESTWKNHIVTSHSIMEHNLEAVKDALKDPIAVYSSEEWEDTRDVFFGRNEKATYGKKLCTKVVVDRPDEYNDEGRVVSAWPEKEIKGNIKEGGLKHVKIKP